MEVRLIKLSYQNRAGEKGGLILVTTLLDRVKHDAIEPADLYARRWDIELKLRDLKTTPKMEFFAVKKSGDGTQDHVDEPDRLQPDPRPDAACSRRNGEASLACEFQGSPGSGMRESRKLSDPRWEATQAKGSIRKLHRYLRHQTHRHPTVPKRTEGGQAKAEKPSAAQRSTARIRGSFPPLKISESCLIPCHSHLTPEETKDFNTLKCGTIPEKRILTE